MLNMEKGQNFCKSHMNLIDIFQFGFVGFVNGGSFFFFLFFPQRRMSQKNQTLKKINRFFEEYNNGVGDKIEIIGGGEESGLMFMD